MHLDDDPSAYNACCHDDAKKKIKNATKTSTRHRQQPNQKE